IKDPDVIGLAIGTRPDCIDENTLSYLRELSQTHEIILEYGLESFHEQTLIKVNRLHTVKDFFRTYDITKKYEIPVCVHLMLGFPWETENDFNETCLQLKKHSFDFVKIHQLQVVKNTMMANDYRANPFRLWSIDEYIEH